MNKDVEIGGFVPFTTIDYPGKLAAVFFLVGCPLRCAYCSNPALLKVGKGEYDPKKLLDWLKSRLGRIEAVVFSGGEPLMQGDAVIDYMKKVKDLGFFIGLHTNGFYPDVLRKAAGTLDWIGLDFKALREKYPSLTGQSDAYDNMMKSLDIWLETGKDLEVRTTCDPRFLSKADLLEIAKKLNKKGVTKFAIQKYIPHFETPENKTTPADRSQFFMDKDLKQKINSLFDSVVWRE